MEGFRVSGWIKKNTGTRNPEPETVDLLLTTELLVCCLCVLDGPTFFYIPTWLTMHGVCGYGFSL